MRALPLAALAAMLVFSACLSARGTCVPGSSVSCTCVDGSAGVRTCSDNARFGACQCGVDLDGGSGDGGDADAGHGEPCGSLTCQLDETCDATLDPPVCVNVCTGTTTGCGDGMRCDLETRTCVPVTTCDPATCAAGEGCWDVNTLLAQDPQPGSVCTCVPSLTDPQSGAEVRADSCASLGKACHFDYWHPAATHCTAPEQFDRCSKASGCAEGLECLPSIFTGEDGLNRCVRPCTQSADCPDADMKCWPNQSQYPPALRHHCFYNYCAISMSGQPDRSAYYRSCPASGTSDGTCVPLVSEAYNSETGMCVQSGTAPSGGECDPKATRAQPSKLCPVGEYCEQFLPDAEDRVRGICRKLCNGAPAGSSRAPDANCAAQQTCTDESGASQTPGVLEVVRMGFCRPSCDLLASTQQCTTADVLGHAQGCMPNARAIGTTGACEPLSSGPSGAGGGCSVRYTDITFEFDCGDRLVCLDDSACHAWCDRKVCTGTSPCPACLEGQTCQSFDPGTGQPTGGLGVCR